MGHSKSKDRAAPWPKIRKTKFQNFLQTQGKHYCFIRSRFDCGAHWFAKSCFFGLPCCPQGVPRGCPQGPRHSKRAKAKKQNISKTLWWSVEVIEVIRAALMTSRASERAWLTTLCAKGPEKAQKTKSRFFVLQALTPARRFCRKRAFAQNWASGFFPAQGLRFRV